MMILSNEKKPSSAPEPMEVILRKARTAYRNAHYYYLIGQEQEFPGSEAHFTAAWLRKNGYELVKTQVESHELQKRR
jgi:hypothetical protein